MSDRARMLGERVEIRRKRQRVGVNCCALQDRLRAFVSPTLQPEDMDGDSILDTAAVLHSELGELKILDRKLDVLTSELGE